MSDRFAFGKNWTAFLSVINEDRIASAVEKLSAMVGDLKGKTFLDIGSGSGIHSLAAVRLGATQVRSFDYDQDSVDCTAKMKRCFAPNANWTIEQGSALDENFMRSLGQFDVVYSWGVLHHTGDMWKALELATVPAKDVLMIAIYNDEGRKSKAWKAVKAKYVRSGAIGRKAIELGTLGYLWGMGFIVHPRASAAMWRSYIQARGMSPWYDIVDWAGGYPFEVARPDRIFAFFTDRGFSLHKMNTCIGHGCNEFVFKANAGKL
jgi:SAM-dependent methyltransferase